MIQTPSRSLRSEGRQSRTHEYINVGVNQAGRGDNTSQTSGILQRSEKKKDNNYYVWQTQRHISYSHVKLKFKKKKTIKIRYLTAAKKHQQLLSDVSFPFSSPPTTFFVTDNNWDLFCMILHIETRKTIKGKRKGNLTSKKKKKKNSSNTQLVHITLSVQNVNSLTYYYINIVKTMTKRLHA